MKFGAPPPEPQELPADFHRPTYEWMLGEMTRLLWSSYDGFIIDEIKERVDQRFPPAVNSPPQ